MSLPVLAQDDSITQVQNLTLTTDAAKKTSEEVLKQVSDLLQCDVAIAKRVLSDRKVMDLLMQWWQADYEMTVIPKLLDDLKDQTLKPLDRRRAAAQLEKMFAARRAAAPTVQINQHIEGNIDQIILERFERRMNAKGT